MNTKIEWTDETWNPVTGCTKVSHGCKNCYAEREWPRLRHLLTYAGRAFTDVACHTERLDLPLRWKRPRRIFVNSMSDLFHEDVSDEFIERVLTTTMHAPQHIFQILTKRPERMLSLMQRWTDMNGRPQHNLWLGVSIEDQATAEERIPMLLQTPATVRWISAEPLLGPVDLFHVKEGDGFTFNALSKKVGIAFRDTGLDWVVCGGESGPRARTMHPDWVRCLRDQCRTAYVPFHFKQWGAWLPINQMLEEDMRKLYPEPPEQDPERSMPCKVPTCGVRSDGFVGHGSARLDAFLHVDGHPGGGMLMFRVGKKVAGRRLDGRIWDEIPETNPCPAVYR